MEIAVLLLNILLRITSNGSFTLSLTTLMFFNLTLMMVDLLLCNFLEKQTMMMSHFKRPEEAD